MAKANTFNKTVGIIGGGQLGKMLMEAGLPWNTRYIILEPDSPAPASGIASEQIKAALTDNKAIVELAGKCDVITYEIEHVGVETLLMLEKEGVNIIPSPKILSIIKDKGLQKQFYLYNGINSSLFVLVNSPSEWKDAVQKLPGDRFVAKSRTGGYDGKGVAILNKKDIDNPANIPFEEPSVLEAFVPCQKELSVIVARDAQGKVETFPLVEMEFDPQANLVKYLFTPASVNRKTEEECIRIATECVEKLEGIGIFAVELFLTSKNEVLVNEIAPRPHNSGHHTIEACLTSQYEQLNRILLGLPLGKTTLLQATVMINLLGSPDFTGAYSIENLDEIMNIPGVFIHLYGKTESRPMRKMGHITIVDADIQRAKEKAGIVERLFRFVPEK